MPSTILPFFEFDSPRSQGPQLSLWRDLLISTPAVGKKWHYCLSLPVVCSYALIRQLTATRCPLDPYTAWFGILTLEEGADDLQAVFTKDHQTSTRPMNPLVLGLSCTKRIGCDFATFMRLISSSFCGRHAVVWLLYWDWNILGRRGRKDLWGSRIIAMCPGLQSCIKGHQAVHCFSPLYQSLFQDFTISIQSNFTVVVDFLSIRFAPAESFSQETFTIPQRDAFQPCLSDLRRYDRHFCSCCSSVRSAPYEPLR